MARQPHTSLPAFSDPVALHRSRESTTCIDRAPLMVHCCYWLSLLLSLRGQLPWLLTRMPLPRGAQLRFLANALARFLPRGSATRNF